MILVIYLMVPYNKNIWRFCLEPSGIDKIAAIIRVLETENRVLAIGAFPGYLQASFFLGKRIFVNLINGIKSRVSLYAYYKMITLPDCSTKKIGNAFLPDRIQQN